jgi:phosphatidylinositol phospholipase C delta
MAEPAKVNVVAPVEPASQASSAVAAPPSSTAQDLSVPQLLLQGTSMIKVSNLKQKTYDFRIDPDEGQLSWKTKSGRQIYLQHDASRIS